MTVQTRIIAALLCAITLAGGYFATYNAGKSDGYHQRDLELKAENEALAVAALAAQTKQSEQLIGAINARTEKTKSNRADASGTDVERSGVRDAFAQRAANLPAPSADACTHDRAAFAELLITVGQAVDQLAADAERIAREADGHAADSLMYQRIGGIAPP